MTNPWQDEVAIRNHKLWLAQDADETNLRICRCGVLVDNRVWRLSTARGCPACKAPWPEALIGVRVSVKVDDPRAEED